MIDFRSNKFIFSCIKTSPPPPPAILDEFQTPPSLPTVEEAEECGADISSLVSQSASLQGALHSLSALQRLQLPHEKYLLCRTDLQVSVGKVEESEGNWSPPTSTTHNQHLINSFSLSVKMRRLGCGGEWLGASYGLYEVWSCGQGRIGSCGWGTIGSCGRGKRGNCT